LVGLVVLALGVLASLAVATSLLWGPPADQAVRAATDLCLETGRLALVMATQPHEPLPAAVRQAIGASLDQLSHQGLTPATVGQAQAQWDLVIQHWSVGDDARLAPALAALGRHAETLASEAGQRSRGQERQRDVALAAGATAAAAILAWAGANIRRQRRNVRHLVHRVSDDLGSGAWQSALRSLRDDRLGAPSAFDALASGVEEVLGTSERRWQALADLAADWYWESDAAYRISWVSGTGPLARLGVQPADLVGRRYDEVDAFDAPADGWSRLSQVLEAGRAFRDLELSAHAPGPDGETLWVAISGRPRLDESGRILGYEGVGRDITERKRAHERLRASDQRWALMAGLASDYYWETDDAHRVLPLRPEVARRFGVMAERSEGRTPWEAYPDAMPPERWAEYRADIDARRPYRGVEMEIDIGEGRWRIVSTSGIPRFDGQGRFLGYHGVGRDITMRREAERLLLRHNDALQRAVAERTHELEQINRDLDAFGRELAHELRTPIGHVQGLAHLLVTKAGDRLAPDELQLIGLQLHAARHMRETVDALLMLARSTTQPLAFEPVDLSAMALEIAADLPAITRDAPVRWTVQPGLHVHAAPSALRIVLTNLMGNAAKFTRRRGDPQVQVSGQPDGEMLRLRISDNGSGFDMAQAERLFKPFGRLHRGDDHPGTGIGLTIVQRIVQRHGGEVRAHGEPGVGAWFECTLPLRPRMTTEPAEGGSPAASLPSP